MVLTNYAKTFANWVASSEAADYAERAYLKAKQVDDQMVIYQARYTCGRLIYIDQRDVTRAAADAG